MEDCQAFKKDHVHNRHTDDKGNQVQTMKNQPRDEEFVLVSNDSAQQGGTYNHGEQEEEEDEVHRNYQKLLPLFNPEIVLKLVKMLLGFL